MLGLKFNHQKSILKTFKREIHAGVKIFEAFLEGRVSKFWRIS